ncbi:MAG TPA: hypothetical protein PLL09_12610 [Flavobacterium sp.]|uniref:hypothetical protein n=1 Tax=unclassified Flavobacterium TaxID=196869 RepID=UPI0025BBDA55|nr:MULTISPECIES: hypothetical protein [unclassified Flavobacterium]HRE78653.1 hypothetical protein [Flavobacterium sp.]
MKKVILSLVFVAALTVVSCKEKEAEVVVDETATEVVEEATEVIEEATEVIDSTVQATEAPAETPAQ